MGDWDFSIFQLIPLMVLAGLMLISLSFVKNRTAKKILKLIIISLVIYSLYRIVIFKINTDRRDAYRESIGN
ncbi:MAG: hypothetical protein U0X41_10835 [Chitinophagales bacterium]